MAVTNAASLDHRRTARVRQLHGVRAALHPRSLDIGLGRQDAFKLWARSADESAAIRSQYVAYQELKLLRCSSPSETAFEALEGFIGKLMRVAAFDLAQERIECFSAFRFLYERLLGAEARPWLPSAFCAAARCRRSARAGARCCSNA